MVAYFEIKKFLYIFAKNIYHAGGDNQKTHRHQGSRIQQPGFEGQAERGVSQAVYRGFAGGRCL